MRVVLIAAFGGGSCPGPMVKDHCLADSPMLPDPVGGNWTSASCCAACVAEPQCSAWNTNKAQKSCHLRSSVADPNPSRSCDYGIVRPPPPPPPPPAPAPPGAKNLLVLINDDLRVRRASPRAARLRC